MQYDGDLLVVETAKVSQLNYLAAPRILFGQALQRFVQTNQFAALFWSDGGNFLERDLLRATASLCVSMSPRVVDQDAPHYLRRDREEVRTIRPVHILLINQTDVGFIDQGSGLKCVVFPLPAHVTARQAVEFVVDQRVQLVQSGLLPLAPLSEQFSNLMSGGVLQYLSRLETHPQITQIYIRVTCGWLLVLAFQAAPMSPGLRNILLTSPTWSSSSAIIRRA